MCANAARQTNAQNRLNPGVFVFCAYLYLQLPLTFEIAAAVGRWRAGWSARQTLLTATGRGAPSGAIRRTGVGMQPSP